MSRCGDAVCLKRRRTMSCSFVDVPTMPRGHARREDEDAGQSARQHGIFTYSFVRPTTALHFHCERSGARPFATVRRVTFERHQQGEEKGERPNEDGDQRGRKGGEGERPHLPGCWVATAASRPASVASASVHSLFFRPSCPSEAEINFSFKPPLPFIPLSLSSNILPLLIRNRRKAVIS